MCSLFKSIFGYGSNEPSFPDLPNALVDHNGFILDTNSVFDRYFKKSALGKSVQELIAIKNVDNKMIFYHWGMKWVIETQKLGSNSRIYLIPVDLLPQIWTTTPVPMCLLSMKGEILFINPSFRNLFPRIRENDFITKYSDLNFRQYGVKEVVILEKRYFINIEQNGNMILITIVDCFTQDKRKAMQQLISSVVHDFRNVLSVISGYGQLIQEDPSYTVEYVDKILDTSDKAMVMISNLLKFIKSQNNQNVLVKLADVLTAMEKVIGAILGPDIAFELNIAENKAVVNMSESDLERIITNMVINGKEAMGGVGTLKISLQKKYFEENWYSRNSLVRSGFYAWLRFEDTGSGISEENLEKIFSPFFSTKANGNGLGLSTILSMVQESFGAVECSSEINKGTIFDIYLPLIQPSVTPAKSKEIMLVEDSPDVLEIFKIALAKNGFTVHAFLNAEDAFSFLDSKPGVKVDLLITDANLPGRGGNVVASRLRGTNSQIKILVVSGFEQERIADLFPSDAIFMTKPVGLAEFIKTVQNILMERQNGR